MKIFKSHTPVSLLTTPCPANKLHDRNADNVKVLLFDFGKQSQ